MVTATPTKKKSKTVKGVELFKAGIRKDSKGRTKAWTTEELQDMAEAYNSVAGKEHDAPIVVGHDGNISYGWLSKCYVKGGTILGDYRDVDAQFAEEANAGRYRKRSISIYPANHPDNPAPGRANIRHVAYVPVPAVKGMADHEFDEGDEFETYEFAEFAEPMTFANPIEAMGHLVGTMRDRAIEAEGLEAANQEFPKEAIEAFKAFAGKSYVTSDDFQAFGDRVMTQFAEMDQRLMELAGKDYVTSNDFQSFGDRVMMRIAEINQRCAEITQHLGQTLPMYTEASTDETPNMTTQETVSEAVQEPAAAVEGHDFSEILKRVDALESLLGTTQAALAESNGKVAVLEQENLTLAAQRERDGVQSFCEGLVAQRKLRPTDVAKKVALALAIADDSPLEFSENGQVVSKTPRQRYLEDLAAGKELWSDSALPTSPDQDPSDFAEAEVQMEGFDRDSLKRDRQIRAKAREMGKNPDLSADYAEAMEALGISY